MSAARRSNRFARFAAGEAGRSSTFGLAAFVVLGWVVTGLLFGFSDTWQLAMCTSTAIVSFVMVVLIRNTQNRDGAATQIKLDKISRATMGAHNVLLDLEERSDDELSVLRAHYSGLVDVTDGMAKRVAHRPQNQ